MGLESVLKWIGFVAAGNMTVAGRVAVLVGARRDDLVSGLHGNRQVSGTEVDVRGQLMRGDVAVVENTQDASLVGGRLVQHTAAHLIAVEPARLLPVRAVNVRDDFLSRKTEILPVCQGIIVMVSTNTALTFSTCTV